MAAFGTKKLGADRAVQLTFPKVFSEEYAAEDLPFGYLPHQGRGRMDIPVGTDFMSRLHEQRMMDAHHMAMARVRATQMARSRAFSSHQGYFGMPDPVLGQRIYANPSYGALESSSARRSGSVPAPFQTIERNMTGGVLRSAQGQAYGKARLLARAQQLDGIELAKQSFKAGLAAPAPTTGAFQPTFTETQMIPDTEEIELQLNLQSIINTLMGGDFKALSSGVLTNEALSIIRLMIPYAEKTADLDDLSTKFMMVGNITELLEDLADPNRIDIVLGEAEPAEVERYQSVIITLKDLFELILQFFRGMIAFGEEGTKTLAQRRAKVKNLIETLGFKKFYRYANLRSVGALPTVGGDEIYDMDDEDFDEGAAPREDDEADDRPSAGFDSDERQTFGYDSGSYLTSGRAAGSYFGESASAPWDAAQSTGLTEAGALQFPPSLPSLESANVRAVGRDETTGLPSVAVERAPAASGQRISRQDLPKTVEGFREFVSGINRAGGVREDGSIGEGGRPIRIYANSLLENIRRNLIRRLRL